MEEKILCTMCEKPIEADNDIWEWGEESAHKECVLKRADTICSKDCGYFSISGGDEDCRDCSSDMREITEDDKERWRNK